MSRRPEVLTRMIREIQTKTSQNRKMAAEARETADAAFQNASEVDQVRGPQTGLRERGRRDLTLLLSRRRSGDEERDQTL